MPGYNNTTTEIVIENRKLNEQTEGPLPSIYSCEIWFPRGPRDIWAGPTRPASISVNGLACPAHTLGSTRAGHVAAPGHATI